MTTLKYPKVQRAGRWFDVRRRRLGMWAYAINRITGIGLVVYLYLHLAVLSLLSRGPTAWDSFVSMARSPFISRSMLCYLPGYSFTGSMACVLHSRGLA